MAIRALADTTPGHSEYTFVNGATANVPPAGATQFDVDWEHAAFNRLKQQSSARNYEYFLLRQAVAGNFQWPRNWPNHIDRIKHNMVKPISERFATLLMGKGFNLTIERPNTLEFRDKAERAEKILKRLITLSHGKLQFEMGAKTGSQLGRTIFKVFVDGEGDSKHASFTYCQPDYFYGVPAGTNQVGEWAQVYYSYPIDLEQARRQYGDRPYQSEAQLSKARYYDPIPEQEASAANIGLMRQRRIPVFECWTNELYLLEVGGQTVYNGSNPFRWKDTGKGFIPYVIIENIRNAGDGVGESDISQARELNEHLNYLLSRKAHIVGRWLMPTLIWEGAPQNYSQILQAVIGGGGGIPTRIGSRLYFLSHDNPDPGLEALEGALRHAILESSGMNEIALQGTVQGSINTGPALEQQMAPVLSTIDKKRTEWESGLSRLFAMMLNEQERVGDSKALGQAVVNNVTGASLDGELVDLSGKDIDGLREVTIQWPGILPKDDLNVSRFELEKFQGNLQSFYTTLKNLGEEYPDDEISRIRMENTDPALKGADVAKQQKDMAQAAAAHAQAGTQAMQQMQAMQGGPQDQGAPPGPEGPPSLGDAQGMAQGLQGTQMPSEHDLVASGNPGAVLRELKRRAAVRVSHDEHGEPQIEGY